MIPGNFKDIVAAFGPDGPKTPALSRAQRLAKVVPPIVAEVMEPRRHLSITAAGATGGTLTVTGDSEADSIRIEYVLRSGDNWYDVYDGATLYASFRANLVSAAVAVYAGGGNDTVDFSANTAENIAVPGHGYGEDGNDVITGSSNADSLVGGLGYDTIHGWQDADVITGGTGVSGSSD